MEIYAIVAADRLAFKCCLAEKCDGIVLSNGCLGSNNILIHLTIGGQFKFDVTF